MRSLPIPTRVLRKALLAKTGGLDDSFGEEGITTRPFGRCLDVPFGQLVRPYDTTVLFDHAINGSSVDTVDRSV
jgi:hypothetical protein